MPSSVLRQLSSSTPSARKRSRTANLLRPDVLPGPSTSLKPTQTLISNLFKRQLILCKTNVYFHLYLLTAYRLDQCESVPPTDDTHRSRRLPCNGQHKPRRRDNTPWPDQPSCQLHKQSGHNLELRRDQSKRRRLRRRRRHSRAHHRSLSCGGTCWFWILWV